MRGQASGASLACQRALHWTNYLELVAPFPAGARVVRKIDSDTDIVHIFSTEKSAPESRATESAEQIETGWDDLGVLAEKIV